MNVPKEARAILRRMKRRGYGSHTLCSEHDEPPVYYVLVSVQDENKTRGTHSHFYDCDDTSIVACCRDIEYQWEVEK